MSLVQPVRIISNHKQGQRDGSERGSEARGRFWRARSTPPILACLARSKRLHGCRSATSSMVRGCFMQLGAGTSAMCWGARECSMQGGVSVWCWVRVWSLLPACEFHTSVVHIHAWEKQAVLCRCTESYAGQVCQPSLMHATEGRLQLLILRLPH